MYQKNKFLLIIFFLTQISSLFCDQPIIFSAMQKSASVYIGNTLSKGLGKSIITISYPYPNATEINPERLELLVLKNGLARENLNPTPENIEFLKTRNLKLIYHVRDLRQQVISNAHYYFLGKNRPDRIEYFKSLGLDISVMTVSGLIDFHIKNLPRLISMVQDWIDVYESGDLEMMLTTYEDYHDNPVEFIEKILHFYDIPITSYSVPDIAKTEKYNFRKGSKDEWREVLTKEQIETINSMIPPDFFRRFKWIY